MSRVCDHSDQCVLTSLASVFQNVASHVKCAVEWVRLVFGFMHFTPINRVIRERRKKSAALHTASAAAVISIYHDL